MRRTVITLGIASIAVTASILSGVSLAGATPVELGAPGAASGGDKEKEPVAQGESAAIQLNSKQEKALEQAWEANQELTFEEVLTVIGEEEPKMTSTDGARSSTAPDEGYGEVTGNCSTMTLWGDSDGNWKWTNKFFPRSAGPALAGTAQVSTDGDLNLASNFSFDGLEQSEEGQVPYVGFAPTGTSVRAWSWNQPASGSPIVCLGILPVWWN